ncbi:MAG: putative toxin-antitoxin system toxin component, PIN family [Anaerolineales bacterium]|nr:putative toxin-antitoxin system toxin component, PIN family [Anaerolineales bacterium]
MKVVLDTNVFVSGVFFSGPPYQILQAWRAGRIELSVSHAILAEYHRVGKILAEDHPDVDLNPLLEFLAQNAEVVTAPPLPEQVCEDPDDDKFIACALAGRNKVIVSGDKHLLDVAGYQKIEVLKPRKFVTKYLE